MEKEIAFLIWLYDRENEALGDVYEQETIAEIREKFADMFGINEELSKIHSR